MVLLNRIYTRTGDDGTTGLSTGDRVSKFDLRVAAYGRQPNHPLAEFRHAPRRIPPACPPRCLPGPSADVE